MPAVSGTAQAAVRLRPQSLMLTFLGNYVLGRDVAVFSGSFIEVFARLGVGEHAVRSTLGRMVNRGLLARYRDGRRMYFGLTERSTAILADGEDRMWGAAATDDGEAGEGTWTLLAFSMPEDWQSRRHELRSRLTWAGFGPAGNGLWIAPRAVDVRPVIAGLGLDAHVRVFTGPAAPPTDVPRLLADAYDLPAIAAGYQAWLDRWDRPDPMPEAPDDLVRYLLMVTEWLRLIRVDPRIPLRHLPADWPAIRGRQVLHGLRERYQPRAAALAGELVQVIPVP